MGEAGCKGCRGNGESQTLRPSPSLLERARSWTTPRTFTLTRDQVVVGIDQAGQIDPFHKSSTLSTLANDAHDLS